MFADYLLLIQSVIKKKIAGRKGEWQYVFLFNQW